MNVLSCLETVTGVSTLLSSTQLENVSGEKGYWGLKFSRRDRGRARARGVKWG